MTHSRDSVVCVSVDDSDPRDPMAKCDRCGKQGTIARATRRAEPRVTLRFCGDCWPVAWSELRKRQDEEFRRWELSEDDSPQPPGWATSSRSWHDVIEFLGLIKQAEGSAKASGHFAKVAAEISATAHEMSGPMPSEVETFLKRWSTPSIG